MADNLIFQIGLDLETAVKKAESEGASAMKRLEKIFSRQPLVLRLDNSGFEKYSTEFGKNIDQLKARLKELRTQFDAIPLNQKWEQNNGVKTLTADAKQLWDELLRITEILKGVGQGAQQMANQSIREIDREIAALEKLKQKEIKSRQAEQNAINSQSLSYDALMAKLRAWQNIQNRNEVGSQRWEEASRAIRQTKDMLALVTEEMNRAAKAAERIRALREILTANERTMSGLNAKLAEYNSRIQGLEAGSAKFNKTALEIRRLTEELQKATQQMQDFQQKSFQGVSDSLTKGKVQALTQMREQLRQIEADFNRLNQTGAAFNANGGLTTAANDILRQREAIIKQINQMLVTAADAQIQREKEINRIVEQRKAKADAIAAKRKAEQAAIQGNIAKLKEERRILNQQESSIANITAKLQIQQQRLQSAKFGSTEFEKIAKEVERLTNKLDKANQKVRELTGQTQSGASQQSAAVKQVSREFGKQDSYITNLIRKTAALWSINQVGSFLTSVREVTAEFKLQRVSLGAIIQDQTRANQLFSEIKSFALKSPVSILDLTKYTKQLAAYKVGWDGIKTDTKELFDWTKKLTDVSVGLGVSMDRVVLAFGQVRATGHLRASEIRQFTEMGVPIVEELAAKLSKMNGELVTAEQVMDMVSKRGISFELVKEVFDDMTSAGGMFYDMQEKQGDTLYGMWAKLGDAASVMYDQIGNTDSVKNGMKSAIGVLTELMRNWEAIAKTVKWVIIPNAAFAALYKYSTATQRVEAAQAAATAATERKKYAVLQLSAAIKKGNVDDINAANATLQKAKADEVAAQKATTRWGLLKSGFVSVAKSIGAGLGIGAAIAAITTLSYKLFATYENATRLNKELTKIKDETGVEQSRAVTNFESLAKAAVSAADGSKEQRDALEELKRTYGNVIPEQDLTIERLEEMKGNYDALTESIKENIRQQQLQKAIDTVTAETENKVIEEERNLRSRLSSTKFQMSNGHEFYLIDTQIDRIVSNFKRLVSEGENASAALQHAFELEQIHDIQYTFDGLAQVLGLVEEKTGTTGVYTETMGVQIAKSDLAASGLTSALLKQNIELAKAKKTMGSFNAELGVLGNYLDEAKKKVDKYTFTAKENTFEYDEEKIQVTVEAYMKALQDAFDRANVKIDLNKYIQLTKDGDYLVDWQGLDEALAKLNSKWKVPLQGIAKEVKGVYESFVPADPVVKALRDKALEIADNTKLGKDKMRKHLWDGKVALVDHVKALHEAAEAAKAEIHRYNVYISQFGDVGKKFMEFFGFKIDEKTKEFNAITALLNEEEKYLTASEKESVFGKNKKKKGSGDKKSDPRLQNLKDEISLLQKLYAEYKKLEKQEGAARAAEDMRKLAGKTIDMFKTKYKIDLPTNADNLASSLEILYKKMEALGTKAFPTLPKDLAELRWTIENVKIEDLQKNIEAELKRLADRISRTKTAKEFYDKVLGMTGDIQLSANLTVSVYGQNGQDLQDAIREQIITAFETDPEKKVTIDLSEAIDPDTGAINYNNLAKLEEKYKDVLISSRADLRKKLIDEGRKTSEAQVQQWLKDIEKAKDFAQQRIDLATYTANQIAAINARTDLPQADKDKLTKGYQDREAKLLAKLQYDEFKNSEMYIHIFEDLDHASTTALKNMRDRLVALKGQWQNLDPTQVKELTKAIADLDEQIAGRSPFKSIIDGFKGLADARPQKVIDAEMIAATDELAKREEVLAAATKKLTEAQTAQVNAQAEVAQAQQDLEDALAVSGGKETAEVKAAREVLGVKIATFNTIKAASKDSIATAKTEVDKAAEEYEEQKKVIDALVAEGKIREANIKKIELANQKIDKYQQQINEALDGVRKMMEAFGASEEDMQFFDDVVGALNEIVDAGQQAAMSVASFMTGNILGGITSGVSAIGGLVSGFTNLFSAGKVRKANKEIKRQAELLEQLEYTYGRLEASADKLFGRDYLNNYNQQLKVLQAQQKAYLKQAEAERSKGKKADKEKIKEYENQARDTADAIKEMQDDLVAHFTGSSKTDVARQMAQSWIEARASMSDTFAAIKGDYQDLIKNMIVEGAAARVIENALTPMWKDMEAMLDKNDVQGAIDSLVNGMDDALTQANDGMEVLWKALEARGYDMKQLVGDVDSEYTGIAKNVAGATSEEINTVAAIGNTVMYHTSHLPIISQNVAAIYELMSQGKTTALPGSGTAGWTDWQQQAMENYNAIARNTADTVVECRRAAVACEAATEKLNRAFRAKGGTSGFNVFLNS